MSAIAGVNSIVVVPLLLLFFGALKTTFLDPLDLFPRISVHDPIPIRKNYRMLFRKA